MKAKPCIFPAAALLALASMLAAPPCEAAGGGDGRVARDQVKKRAGQEFSVLREEIEVEQRENPHKNVYITLVKATEERFNSQADAVLKKESYAEWEFDYIGERVTQVIIPTMRNAVELSSRLSADEAPAAFTALAQDSAALGARFTDAYADSHASVIVASLKIGNGLVEGAEQVGGSAQAPIGGPPKTPEEIAREALGNSDVAKLAEASAQYVLKPTEPGGTPGGGTGTPGGGTGTNPRPPAPGASNPGGAPTPSGPAGGLIGAIASPAGVSQLFAMNGIQALERRNYGEAFEMARRALAVDAANRSALEVMNAVKGRGEAAAAGASSWGAAKGGAASFAVAGGEAGPAGSGGVSGPAAVAAAGAARLAGERAQNGARAALSLGDSESALGILTKALNHDPNNPALLNLRAQIYGRLGRWEEALKDASAGAALVPGNAALLSIKALAENRTRRWRDALATSERLIAADPRGPWGYANRAHAWAGLGNRDAMLSDINRAAALDPRFQQAAADAALLQLPSEGDVMFLFPGESAKGATNAPAAGRGKSFGLVMGAGIVGGLLLALGLLSLVLAPIKESVVSVFTRAKRAAPATNPAVATEQPASVGGNVGGLIRGQYEISRQIGAGGMGMVYEGTDRSLGRRVAIKKMRDELRQNPRDRERFIIEAKTVASLHHPNIVDIYAIAEDGEDVYLVFEYVDGRTVHDLIQSSGRLGAAEALGVTRAMGEALSYAHSRGVIHRDMKPSNVMLTGDGRVKVMDFGIARMAKDALTRYSMTNTVVGTPPYMAPEQEQGVVRKESDVYALAVCAYEMLTGKLPFIGIGAGMLMNKINMSYIPPSRSIAGLPATLDGVFLKAFQADPDQRYRAPQEFVAALEAAADGARSKTA